MKVSMNRKAKLLLWFAAAIAILFAIVEFSSTYREHYRLKDVSLALYSVGEFDSKDGCWQLKDSIDIDDSLSPILLAVKFDVEYISLKHEFIWNRSNTPEGAFGHLDTISKFEIRLNEQEQSASILNDASRFTHFRKDGILQKPGDWHRADNNGCLLAETFRDPSAFVESYNYDVPGNSNLSSDIRNIHLFQLKNEVVRSLIGQQMNIRISFTDGKIINSSLILDNRKI